MILGSIILGAALFWQASVQMVKVSGLVTDNMGASLPFVAISFKAKNFDKQITASGDGLYEVEIPVGTYEVRGRLQGCKDFRLKNWKAQSGIPNTLNVSLYCPPTPIRNFQKDVRTDALTH
jgi:hypothetical protein